MAPKPDSPADPIQPTDPEAPSLEQLLERHALGDRSPEVMAALNLAAWEAFHAPWEAPPPEEGPAPDAASRAEGAREVERFEDPDGLPLTLDRLAAWASQEGFQPFRHEKRGVLIDFVYNPAWDRRTELRLLVGGRNDDILEVTVTCDRRIPPQRFRRAVRMCNEWNQRCRWPRAFVQEDRREVDGSPVPMDDPRLHRGPESARIVLDYQVQLAGGVSTQTLHRILDGLLGAQRDFWKKAHEIWGL